nr:hypothetical protein CFP56_27826 [Quercus suber]
MQLTLTTTRDPRTEVEVAERHHSPSLDLPSFVPKPKLEANSNDVLIVSQLFDQNSDSWNLQKLRDLFDEHDLEAIQKVLIPSHSQVDNWIWTATNSGEITARNQAQFEGMSPNVYSLIAQEIQGHTILHPNIMLFKYPSSNGTRLPASQVWSPPLLFSAPER